MRRTESICRFYPLFENKEPIEYPTLSQTNIILIEKKLKIHLVPKKGREFEKFTIKPYFTYKEASISGRVTRYPKNMQNFGFNDLF